MRPYSTMSFSGSSSCGAPERHHFPFVLAVHAHPTELFLHSGPTNTTASSTVLSRWTECVYVGGMFGRAATTESVAAAQSEQANRTCGSPSQCQLREGAEDSSIAAENIPCSEYEGVVGREGPTVCGHRECRFQSRCRKLSPFWWVLVPRRFPGAVQVVPGPHLSRAAVGRLVGSGARLRLAAPARLLGAGPGTALALLGCAIARLPSGHRAGALVGSGARACNLLPPPPSLSLSLSCLLS